jgi:hypothetical protein
MHIFYILFILLFVALLFCEETIFGYYYNYIILYYTELYVMFVLGGDDRRPCQHGLTQSGLEAGRPTQGIYKLFINSLRKN